MAEKKFKIQNPLSFCTTSNFPTPAGKIQQIQAWSKVLVHRCDPTCITVSKFIFSIRQIWQPKDVVQEKQIIYTNNIYNSNETKMQKTMLIKLTANKFAFRSKAEAPANVCI